LIGPFGHLENLIYETLESVAVPGLMLSLGVENANAIQEAFKFTRPRLVLLVAPRSFHNIDETIGLPLLVMALGQAWLVCVAPFLLLFLLSDVEGRLLGQVVFVNNGEHASDIFGVFMVSLQIKDESLSPVLKNKTMNLYSTCGMMFLLLQKCWMNSQRDLPFFWTMPARSQLTPEHAHVAQKLLVNSRHRWLQDWINPKGSPRCQVLADDDKQTGR
jgi:hypothetical protein